MPRHAGVRGEAWKRCEKCDFEYPINQLTLQLGLWVCPKCYDDLDVYRRPALISAVLRSSEDEPELGRRVYDVPEELFF